MEGILKDKRFAHITEDPKFRRIPKNEYKIKIDKRFQSMFKDKIFTVKYTVDKRGRPTNQTSTENLRKYYDISSSEQDSSPEELEIAIKKNLNRKKTFVNNIGKSKRKVRDKNNKNDDFSNKSILFLKQDKKSISNIDNENNSCEKICNETEFVENEKSLRTKKKTEIKKKLQNLNVDYARGEGILLSNSSSDENSEYEDENQEINHNWGELDKEIEITDDVTYRLAVCNMDWDRIRAIDLMVLFHSFLPAEGLIDSVTIYPSEFGLKRIKDEELTGPIELIETKNTNFCKNEINNDNDNEKELDYHMEKLRQYQLNRLKYYYAVIVFDSANTANKIYTECDGLEYESSSNKLDLRFIPDDMTFHDEPKEFCNELPDLAKYKPRQFTTTALQQIKVDLTWDETNHERQEITQKLNYGKFDNIDENDIQAYLASGSSEDESEDKVKKQLEGINYLDEVDDPIDKYKLLLKSVEREKEKKEVELEFTWGVDVKEKAEKLVKQKMKNDENLTSFQQYLKKYKTKKIIKRAQKRKHSFKMNNIHESDSEDSIPSNVDINDPYFSEILNNIESKSKKVKNILNDFSFITKDKEKIKQAELELLVMNESEEKNKYHFSMKKIEKAESLIKTKKRHLTKQKKDLEEEASKDNFEINVKDPRFNALFTSYHYNIDPTDSHYRKTKGTEALVQEKSKRRVKNKMNIETTQDLVSEENNCVNTKVNTELNSLIRSIKRNTQNYKKYV